MTFNKRGLQGSLAFLSLTAIAAACLSTVSATSTGSWVSTGTHAISFTNAKALGAVTSTVPMHIVVGLQTHNSDKAQGLIASIANPSSPNYHKFLSPSDFASQFAATAADAKAVTSYLSSQGFSNVKLAPNRLFVEADGTPQVVQAAFNTQLMRYLSVDGKEVFANLTDAQVPSALGGIVNAVVGLQNVKQMHTFLGRQPGSPMPTEAAVAAAVAKVKTQAVGTPAIPPTTFTPAAFQTAYDVGTVPEATNTVISIFTWGDMSQDVKDLAQFRTEQKLDPVNVNVIHVGTGTSTETDGDGEWDMDWATSTGLAGNVKELRVYAADAGFDVNLIPDFNRFVTDDVAVAGSASFGECEYQEILDASIQIYDQIFFEAAVQGQTIFASAGDSGSACYLTGAGVLNGVPLSGFPDTNYPASSPYVMGAGGTSLLVNTDGTYLQEISWDAGGGGPAIFEFSPNWQQPFLPLYTFTEAQQAYKGVPDVAMDADFLLSPGAYVLDGGDTSNGGTSLASPLSLGAWARIQGAHKNSLGYAGPVLYALGTPMSGLSDIEAGKLQVTSSIAGMNDVTYGTNGLYTALPGYDFNTGLGSFDIARVNKLVAPTGIGSFPVLGGLI